jgi:hypothetical protein
VKRAVCVLVAALAVAAAEAGRAGATNECRGLQVCVSVAGPWVVVPAAGTPRPSAEFQLSCPRRFVIGGLDAELSARSIDVSFSGRLGSPVNPGVTTSSSAVFRGFWVGAAGGAPSYRPRLGCIPSSGGSGGIPTARRIFPPGQPTQRRLETVDLHRGVQHVTQRCRPGEHLVGGTHAVGFYTAAPPPLAVARGVRTTQALARDAVVVTVRSGALHGARAVVQVVAVCAGAR